MVNIIASGITRKWQEEWRVEEVTDTNGSLPVYVIAKNQGEHDRRFFIIKASIDKDYMLAEAERIFGNK